MTEICIYCGNERDCERVPDHDHPICLECKAWWERTHPHEEGSTA